MALLSVIRRWHLRDGMAIREIARRTGLSRNTIRKYLNTGVVEPKYPERHSPSKLNIFVLSATHTLLTAEAAFKLIIHTVGYRAGKRLFESLCFTCSFQA